MGLGLWLIKAAALDDASWRKPTVGRWAEQLPLPPRRKHLLRPARSPHDTFRARCVFRIWCARLPARLPILPPGTGACLRFFNPEDRLTTLAQLRILSLHARRDAINVGNIRAAQPHGVVAAKPLLFSGIGVRRRDCRDTHCGQNDGQLKSRDCPAHRCFLLRLPMSLMAIVAVHIVIPQPAMAAKILSRESIRGCRYSATYRNSRSHLEGAAPTAP